MNVPIQYICEFIANSTPESLDEFGRSPLHYCCVFPSETALEILLHLHQFDINHRDVLGWTPLLCLLHSSNQYSRELVIRMTYLLLEYGANPNISSTLTPLMIAVLNRDIVLVNLLLQYGADPNIRTDDSESLLPARSSALSMVVQPPFTSILTDADIHIIWSLLHVVSAGTIFHAIQKVNTHIKNIVLYLMDLKQSKLQTGI